MNKIIISIEGNIGVGKTTFMDILKRNFNESEIVYEPLKIWENLIDTDGDNILNKFYKDQNRWAYSFQNLACITRMTMIEDTIQNTSAKYIFLDRSLGTDKHVFEKMLYNSGKISEIEHNMYNMWCDFYYKYIRPEFNNIIIYLRCSTETAINRIKKRGRVEEKDISYDYINELHKYHEEWLIDDITNNIIVIDCDKDFENDIEYQEEIINTIKLKLDNIILKITNKIEIDFDDLDTKEPLEFYDII